MLPPSVRVFLAAEPADMRCAFDGLTARVQSLLEQDPFSGHLFVFRNKRGDRVKILFWDRSGFCLWYKRLEKGTFRFPEATGSSVEVLPDLPESRLNEATPLAWAAEIDLKSKRLPA